MRSNRKFLRIWARDHERCRYCGDVGDSVDHVIPRSRGGTNADENLVIACLRCNAWKANRTPDEAGMSVQKIGYEMSPEHSAIVRSTYPHRQSVKAGEQRASKRIASEQRHLSVLQHEAQEAAADPQGLHYPFNRARPSAKKVGGQS